MLYFESVFTGCTMYIRKKNYLKINFNKLKPIITTIIVILFQVYIM